MKLLMGTKRQFKMYLDDEMVERLKQAAARFSRDSGQDIVEEIVSIYLPTWIAVNDSMRRAVEFQIRQISPKGGRTVNGSKGVPLAPRSTSKAIPLMNTNKGKLRKAK